MGNKPKQEARAEQDAQIVGLILSGLTYRAVAKKIGLSKSTVCRRFVKAMRERTADRKAQQEIALEVALSRLERCLLNLQTVAKGGDVKANLAIANVVDKMCRIAGIGTYHSQLRIEIDALINREEEEALIGELTRLGIPVGIEQEAVEGLAGE